MAVVKFDSGQDYEVDSHKKITDTYRLTRNQTVWI